jgi:hypothetical protein
MVRKKEIKQQGIPAAPVKKMMPLIDEDLDRITSWCRATTSVT